MSDVNVKVGETVKPMSYSAKRKSIGEISKREKEQAKKITRTTVINPRQIEWTDNIDESSLTELNNVIKELAGALKFPSSKVPLHEIRKVDKAQRREFREQWRAKQTAEIGFDVQNYVQLRSCLAIGVNCVSRGLDLNELVGVIIEKDVSPSIITKLLIPSALAKDVPIIAIDGLKEMFESTTRIRCIALGFKNCCAKISNHFYPLLNLVKLHGKQYLEEPEEPSPPPRSLNELTTIANIEVDDDVLDISQTSQNIPKKGLKRQHKTSNYKSPKIRKTEIIVKPKTKTDKKKKKLSSS